MENKHILINKIGVKHGIILTALSLIIFGISYAVDNYIDPPWWNNLLNILTTFIVIFYGFKIFKGANNGFMSLGEAMRIGIIISLVTALILGVFRYFLVTVIEPDFISRNVELFHTHHPDAPITIEEGKGMMQAWVMSLVEFVVTMLLGLLVALILGIIMKKSIDK